MAARGVPPRPSSSSGFPSAIRPWPGRRVLVSTIAPLLVAALLTQHHPGSKEQRVPHYLGDGPAGTPLQLADGPVSLGGEGHELCPHPLRFQLRVSDGTGGDGRPDAHIKLALAVVAFLPLPKAEPLPSFCCGPVGFTGEPGVVDEAAVGLAGVSH